MLRQRIPVIGGLALAVLVVLVAAEPASAQLRDRLRGRRGFSDRPTPYVVTSMPVVATDTSTVTTTTGDIFYEARPARRFLRRGSGPVYYTMRSAPMGMTAPDTARTAFYPPDSTEPAAAQLTVRVPADAEVLIEGQKMTQTGTLRQFVSPALERGSTYSYEVQAKWTENGREVNRTQKIRFQPGQRVEANFLPPLGEQRPTIRR